MNQRNAEDAAVCLLLRVPRVPSSVSVVRHACTSLLKGFGITSDCIGEIALLLSESCSNAVEHAAGTSDYAVRFEVDHERCLIEVSDPGPGFDVDVMQTSMPVPSSATGRGGPLMAALSDELEIMVDESGTTVRMSKQLDLEPRSLLASA